MDFDYSKLHAALNAMENQTPVFAAINGEAKECTVEWFQLKPMRYVVRTGPELHNVDNILLEHPGIDIPEAGREVRHKATGLIIRSAGYLRNGNLVDDKDQEWSPEDWEDTELAERRRKAEEERAAREAKAAEAKRKKEEESAAAKKKQEAINKSKSK